MLQNRWRWRKEVVTIAQFVSSTAYGFLNLPILRLAGYLSVGRIEKKRTASPRTGLQSLRTILTAAVVTRLLQKCLTNIYVKFDTLRIRETKQTMSQ